MSKKIEDYLHLYLGCRFIYNNGTMVWDGWSGFENKNIYYYTDEERKHIRMGAHIFQVSKIKLLLRPLSDMKEDEAASVYTIERDRILHPATDDHDVRRENNCWKIVRLDHIDTTLFITDNATVYKVTEDNGKPLIEYTRNLPDIFHYLLSKGFDLFNLIPDGLALDATQQQP